jgi:DNA repair protein RadD
MLQAAVEGLDALWVSHRTEILDQLPGRTISVQKMVASGERPQCEVLVLDEAHHTGEGVPRWYDAISGYDKVLGATATPCRGDFSPLAPPFEEMIVAAQPSELIPGGWMVPCKVFRPPEELQGVAMDPVEAWVKYAGNRSGFIFASRVEHAKSFSDRLNAKGVPSAVVWGEMPTDDRKSTVEMFRRGDLRCLSSIMTLTEGVDIPEASIAILATGCSHAGSYLQRVGRILRPAPNKTDALLLDLPGCTHRYDLPGADREYSLTGRPIRAKLPSLTVCQQCGRTFEAGGPCPECGFSPPVKPPRLRVWDMPIEEVIAKAMTPKEKGIGRWRAKMADMDEAGRQAWYRAKQEEGEAKGYKKGWAAFQFKLTFGRWPRG